MISNIALSLYMSKRIIHQKTICYNIIFYSALNISIIQCAISNPEFGFEQDLKVNQYTKSNLGQNWVNESFYSIKEL